MSKKELALSTAIAQVTFLLNRKDLSDVERTAIEKAIEILKKVGENHD
jgi:hypothetical protein